MLIAKHLLFTDISTLTIKSYEQAYIQLLLKKFCYINFEKIPNFPKW
jgi:hypothetical protein